MFLSPQQRKIDDVLFNLEQALRSTDDVKQPPAKKMRFPGSLYSTLAKYGIKTKSKFASDSKPGEIPIIKSSAPHLSAILSRAATRKEKAAQREEVARASVASPSTAISQPAPVEYRPSSTASFLSRLSTYKLSTYSTKPPPIDAVVAAKAGWINQGKERLVCGICKASWVLATRDGLSKDAANALIEKQRVSLVQMHREGCPWRTRQCDDSIYCIPLKSPSVLSKEIKSSAMELDSKKVLEGVEIRHPLTSSQVQALLSALSSVKLPQPSDAEGDEVLSEDRAIQEAVTTLAEPSQDAILTAVFGWSLAPPTLDSRPRTSSAAGTSSVSHTPELSSITRQPSQNDSSISEAGTSRPSRIPVPRSSATTARLQRQEVARKRDETLIHCELCRRRVGLWAFKNIDESAAESGASVNATSSSDSAPRTRSSTAANGPSRLPVRRVSQGPMPKRQFDLLKEHRPFCPYVVRSTVVPSLSSLGISTSPTRSASASHVIPSSRPSACRSSSASSFNFNFSTTRYATHHTHHPEIGSNGTLNDPAAVEGWRAVLTMVMRTGLGRRQRQQLHMRSVSSPLAGEHGTLTTSPATASGENERDGDAMEIDSIRATVEDVKKRGGRDLLRYIKTLFA
ncbi:zf-C3HC-domain-containing protein [Fomitiporia mediterranea MF3/22]|uniref:zf-C3HC-domain-containing protein n=1 Tax=Fomitiporia mediterranea (strain MF3/22) TaxID=694068 RepID=UPI00044097C9|nr:zf-C3HC-domain-containing protein [Fomitiporia mediterranea MF3/22]EJD06936.1 zf-C3HC-domain-containing protein [Fomitiporia mediterranea MF3/22]